MGLKDAWKDRDACEGCVLQTDDGDVAPAGQVEHLAGDGRARRSVAVRDGDAEGFEVLVRDEEGQGPGIVDVVADVGIEDDLHTGLLGKESRRSQQ